MSTYTATAYGKTFSKKTKRAFTHCVIARAKNFDYIAAAWCGSHELASKAAIRLANIPADSDNYILECVVVPVTAA